MSNTKEEIEDFDIDEETKQMGTDIIKMLKNMNFDFNTEDNMEDLDIEEDLELPDLSELQDEIKGLEGAEDVSHLSDKLPDMMKNLEQLLKIVKNMDNLFPKNK
jgi:hypothetical protein